MSKHSMETTIGELLDSPETYALIAEHCPGILTHPMLSTGRSFRFCDALPFVEGLASSEELQSFKEALEAL